MNEEVLVAPGTGGVRRQYLKRYQLLDYNQVTKLNDVMDTMVPIHGTGNFPTLKIKPCELVELVRDRLTDAGIRVRDIRLNGSAATHVLSDDVMCPYKDLDLIFAIEFPVPDSKPPKEKSTTSSTERTRKKRDVNQVKLRQSLPCKEELDDAVDDSGYTSSGSSVYSLPSSPTMPHPPLSGSSASGDKNVRCRTRSIESISSSSSVPSSACAPTCHFLRKEGCWQKVKDVVMDILRDLLPDGVTRTRMSSVVLGGAYVQKMVKVTNNRDRWSLISLNNNTGRNLELKFVESMRRQFEFSVDSFQIILDTYLQFQSAAKPHKQDDGSFTMTDTFHPTVLAESVYGDFAAALRHLRYRRICTHRPEEIRGGGLLRYCNLLVRDYTPGDCDENGNVVFQNSKNSKQADTFASFLKPNDINKLEQHMCSRFFIDFNDINRQQQKLVTYLDNHFEGEEELKFQYLLVLRRVVDNNTVCLMQHERALILDLITTLFRQSLASIVSHNSQDAAMIQQRVISESNRPMESFYKQGGQQVHYCNNFSPSPLSDRSSPLSTYSTVPPSTPGEICSAPESPSPHSRPSTPFAGTPSLQTQVGDAHEAAPFIPSLIQSDVCNCTCSCLSCSRNRQQTRHSQVPVYQPTQYYPSDNTTPYPETQYTPCGPQTPPVYYIPGNVTCFYQPASYCHPQYS